MPYLVSFAWLYYGIEATSCQAERTFSALAHLIGDLRSRMLANKVERMMFIRLNRHLIDEVRDSDAAGAQARARVAKSTQIFVGAQEERLNMSVDLTVQIPRMVMWIVSSSTCPCSVFSRHLFVCVCCCCFRGLLRYQSHSIFFCLSFFIGLLIFI